MRAFGDSKILLQPVILPAPCAGTGEERSDEESLIQGQISFNKEILRSLRSLPGLARQGRQNDTPLQSESYRTLSKGENARSEHNIEVKKA
jgi:hypothetical protein